MNKPVDTRCAPSSEAIEIAHRAFYGLDIDTTAREIDAMVTRAVDAAFRTSESDATKAVLHD